MNFRENWQLMAARGASGLQALIGPRLVDETERRHEYVLNVILIGSIALLFLLNGVVAYTAIRRGGSSSAAISLIASSLFLGFFVVLYALSRRGLVHTASYLLVGAYFIANGYAAYRWGVTIPTVLVGYAFLVVMAGMIVGSRFGFMTAGMTGAYVGSLWWLQLDGLVSVDSDELVMGDGLSLVGLYFLITTIAWLSNREIEHSLARARSSEDALKKQRDWLEMEVEERTRELRESQFAKVEQLYRFAEFGQMASGLFHDLVNLFNAVLLHMQQPTTEGDAGVAVAKERLEKAGVLTKRVNDFVAAIRKQLIGECADGLIDVMREIRQIVDLVMPMARNRNVQIRMSGGDIEYFGNCPKFHQAIMNLILNAIESYDDMPHIVGAGRVVVVDVVRRDNEITIAVADNGRGITRDMQDVIFRPFFTTKSEEKGMGIGLAVVKKIIENDFGGAVTVSSSKGSGATFTVHLPRR